MLLILIDNIINLPVFLVQILEVEVSEALFAPTVLTCQQLLQEHVGLGITELLTIHISVMYSS